MSNERPRVAGGIARAGASMRALFDRHAPADGFFPSPLAGLQLIRASAPTDPLSVFYRPALCLVLGGRKRVFLNNQITEYGSDGHLVISQDLPALGQVVEASPLEPYLCVHLRFEQAEINRIVLEHGPPQEPEGASTRAARGLYVEPSSAALLDAILRLVRLLDAPADQLTLEPLIRREIVYRLLSSAHGWRLARTARTGCCDHRIARVLEVLRERFRETIGVRELADIAHLSPSALNLNFKAVTSFTPLQYVKQLRLQDARRLVVSTEMDAAAVAMTIGYDSPSQFSREYARMFGEPPLRDRARLRISPSAFLLQGMTASDRPHLQGSGPASATMDAQGVAT